jgi:hypothetical protein
MQKRIASKDRKIAAQEKELDHLRAEVLRLQGAAIPATSLGTKVIGRNIFDLMGSGDNVGKWVTQHWVKAFLDGKSYREWTILAEAEVKMGNRTEMTEKAVIGDKTFTLIPDGKNKGKWISEPEIFEAPQGIFVQWKLREEVEDKHKFVL